MKKNARLEVEFEIFFDGAYTNDIKVKAIKVIDVAREKKPLHRCCAETNMAVEPGTPAGAE